MAIQWRDAKCSPPPDDPLADGPAASAAYAHAGSVARRRESGALTITPRWRMPFVKVSDAYFYWCSGFLFYLPMVTAPDGAVRVSDFDTVRVSTPRPALNLIKLAGAVMDTAFPKVRKGVVKSPVSVPP